MHLFCRHHVALWGYKRQQGKASGASAINHPRSSTTEPNTGHEWRNPQALNCRHHYLSSEVPLLANRTSMTAAAEVGDTALDLGTADTSEVIWGLGFRARRVEGPCKAIRQASKLGMLVTTMKVALSLLPQPKALTSPLSPRRRDHQSPRPRSPKLSPKIRSVRSFKV